MKRGGIQVFLGFGTLLLIFVVLYVLISMNNPQQGAQIAENVRTLASAASGK